jgi:hypothetical protein
MVTSVCRFTYEAVDEPLPIWVQWEEPPDGGACDEPPDGGVSGEPPGGRVVDDPLGASPAADEELLGAVVGGEVPVVAALATAAPPPTRTPASATPASVCRSRIFIPFTSFFSMTAPAYRLTMM